MHGYRLNLASCERIAAMLAGKTVEERRNVPGLAPGPRAHHRGRRPDPHRVDPLAGLSEVEVSDRDILHGAALNAS